VRIWEHDLSKKPAACIRELEALLTVSVQFAFNAKAQRCKDARKRGAFAKAAKTHLWCPAVCIVKFPVLSVISCSDFGYGTSRAVPWCRGAFALKFHRLTASFRLRACFENISVGFAAGGAAGFVARRLQISLEYTPSSRHPPRRARNPFPDPFSKHSKREF
jgi:hypothetical protein